MGKTDRLISLAILVLFAARSSSAANFSESACPSPASGLTALERTYSELSRNLSRFIIGTYSTKTFRQTCKIEFTTPEGNQALCSGTLVGKNTILTAAHCKAKKDTETVSCLCGTDPKTGKEIFADSRLVSPPEAHPTYGTPEAGPLGFDVKIGRLARAPACPSVFPKIKPASIPPSLEAAKGLIASGNCFFSGFGTDNEGAIGKLRSTAVPRKHVYESNSEGGITQLGAFSPTEWVTYVNESTAKITAEKMEKLKDDLLKQGKISPDQAREIENRIGEYTLKTRAEIKDDPNRENAFAPGDSGGSLICVGKDGKPYLVGTLVQGFQSAIILNDPSIWRWLKPNL